jgi:hypothetical protein
MADQPASPKPSQASSALYAYINGRVMRYDAALGWLEVTLSPSAQ